MKHRSSRLHTASAAAILAGLAVALAPSASHAAADELCGATLTESYTLTEDVDCTGYQGVAITLAASGITLDGAGFRLLAPDAPTAIAIAPDVDDVTVHNLDVLGWCTGTGISITGGAGHTLSNLRVDGRANAVVASDTAGLTLADLQLDASAETGLTLSGLTLPVTLSNLAITNSAVGLSLADVDGPLTLDADAIADLSGHDVGLRFVQNVSNVTVADLTIDAADIGIDASGAGLEGLAFQSLDLSCPIGTGTGLALRGASHTVADVAIVRRAVGVDANAATGLSISGLTVSGATDAGLRLASPGGALSLTNLAVRYSKTAVHLSGYSPATPVTFSGFDVGSGAGAFRELTDNDVNLLLEAVTDVAFTDFSADAIITSIDASFEDNERLTFEDIDVSTKRRGGTGVLLGGSSHTVRRLTANDLQFGLRAVSVVGLTLDDVTATRCNGAGVRLESVSGAVSLRQLDLRDNSQALALVDFSGTQATPRVIDGWDEDTGEGVIVSVAGSLTGLHVSDTRDLVIEDLRADGRQAGVYLRDGRNARITARRVDASGFGDGNGFDVSGADHRIEDCVSNDRAIGVFLSAASNVRLSSVESRRCSNAGVSLIGFNTSHQPPIFQNLILTDNWRAFSFYSYSRATTVTGVNNIDVSRSAIGVEAAFTQNLTLVDLTLDATQIGANCAHSSNSNLTFRRIDASGQGRGVGVLARGNQTRIEDVTANDRETGVSVTNAPGVILTGITADRATSSGLTVQNITSAQAAPVFEDFQSRDSVVGLRLVGIESALTIDGDLGFDTAGSLTALELNGTRNTTLTNLDLDVLGTGIYIDSGNTSTTISNSSVVGSGLGTAIQLGRAVSTSATLAAGSNHSIVDVTVTGFETGVRAINPDNLLLRRVSLLNNTTGLELAALGQSFPGTLTAPTLDTVSFSGNHTAIALASVRQAFTLDGTTQGLTFTGNQRGITLVDSTLVTVRNLTLTGREHGILASTGNTSLTFGDLDLSGPAAGVGLQLGLDAANTLQGAGAGHVVERVTANDRAVGVLALAPTNLTLRDLSIGRAFEHAVRVVTPTRPLTLQRLSLTDSSVGLELDGIAGTSTTPWTLRGVAADATSAAITSLEGSDTGLRLLRAAWVTVHDLAAANRGTAIEASNTSNGNLIFRDLDLSGPSFGTGLSLGGNEHSIERVTANDRTTGLNVASATNLVLSDVTARRASGHAVRLQSLMLPASLSAVRVADSAVGLRIESVTGTGSLALNATALPDIAGNLSAIQLVGATGVTVDEASLGVSGSAGTWKTAPLANDALCGTVLTASLTLTADLHCPATTGAALTLGANGITLDGAGYRVLAPHASAAVAATGFSDLTVRNLDVSGAYAAGDGVQLAGGSRHTLEGVTARRRARGVVVAGATDVAIADLTVSNTSTTGLRLDGVVLPLSLSGVAMTDGAGSGLVLANLDGNPSDAAGAHLTLDGAAISSLAGHATSVLFAGGVTQLELDAVPGLDGRVAGVDGLGAGNSNLRLVDLDVTGVRPAGHGVLLSGSGHLVSGLQSFRRGTAVDLRNGASVSLLSPRLQRSAVAGVRLAGLTGPPVLRDIVSERAGVGLLATGLNGSAVAPFVVDAFDGATGAVTSLAMASVSLHVDTSTHVRVDGLSLNGALVGLRAATGNSHLTLSNLDLSSTYGLGTGLDIAGASHDLQDLAAGGRATGVAVATAPDLVMARVSAAGATVRGFLFSAPGALDGLEQLSARGARLGLEFSGLQGTAEVPRVLTGWDDAFLTGAVGNLDRTRTAIRVANSSNVKLVGVFAPGIDQGIDATTGNANATFEDIDVSGPSASGTGLALTGSGHVIDGATSIRRAIGLALQGTPGVTLRDVESRMASNSALRLAGFTGNATFSNMTLSQSNVGLALDGVTASAAAPVVIDAWDPAGLSGAIVDISANDTSISLLNSRHVTVREITLDGQSYGLLASGTGGAQNTSFTLEDLDLSGAGWGVGLQLQGTVHTLSGVTANLRETGLRFQGAGFTAADLSASASSTGLHLTSYNAASSAPVFDGVALRNNITAWRFSSFSRVTTFDAAFGVDVAGSVNGVVFDSSTSRVTLDGLRIEAIAKAVDYASSSSNTVLTNVDASGVGLGVGLDLKGTGHIVEDVDVSDNVTGMIFSSSNGGGQTIDGLVADRSSTGIVVQSISATQPVPSFSNVSVRHSSNGISLASVRRPFVLDGSLGFDFEGVVSGIRAQTFVYDLTLKDLDLPTLGTAVETATFSDRTVFENLDATGFGRGTAFIVPAGSGHAFRNVAIGAREGGFSLTSLPGAVVNGLSASGISGVALVIAAVPDAQAAPSLDGVSVRNSATAIRFDRVSGPLVIDGNDLAELAGNRVGIELASDVQRVTFRGVTTRASTDGILATGPNNHANTFEAIDASGQCRGRGLALAGQDHRLDGVTVARRDTAVAASDVAALSIVDSAIHASRRGLTVTGTPPLVQTTVATDAANSSTRVRLANTANVYVGQTLRFAGVNDRVVATVSGNVITLATALPATPAVGTTVRSLSFGAPALSVTGSEVCANGVGVQTGTISTTATGNYWRDASGPTHSSNPDGLGDRVTATSITLSPWQSVPFDKATPFCNTAPVAAAGEDLIVCEGDDVTLDGTGTFDPDDEPVTYAWTQVSGPSVVLTPTDAPEATFTAPGLTLEPGETPAPAELVFRLSVADDVLTRADETTVTVYFQNLPPVPSAGDDFDVTESSDVTLDATGSADPEGADLSYTWTQISGIPVTLEGADTANPTFQAPDLDVGGEPASEYLVFEVTATDTVPEFFCGEPKSASTTVTVEVRNQNTRPDVVVTDEQLVCAGDIVLLDAGDSTDRDGDPLAFVWSQTAGEPVTLQDADTNTAAFVAPVPEGEPGPEPNPITLDFEVVVDDGFDTNSATTSVVVRRTNAPPVAVAEGGVTVDEGGEASFDATGSEDPEATALTYSWRQVSGTAATLDGADTATPGVTLPLLDVGGGPIEETLVFEVSVTDAVPDGRCGEPETTTATVEVVVRNVNTPPTASAGDDGVSLGGSTVTLDGTLSADPDDDTLTFAWEQVSGLPATLSGADTAQPTFVTPARGEEDSEFLVFRVTVNDGFGGSDTDEVTIIIGRACQSAADCGDGNPCTEDICLELGYCAWAPEPPRTDCNDGWLCDGANTCVQCLEQADCVDPWTCTIDTCVDFACEYAAQPEGHPCEVGTCSGILAEPACIPDVETFVNILYPTRNGFVPSSDVEVSGTGEPASELVVTLSDRNDPRINYRLETTVAEDGTWAVLFLGIPDGGWSALVQAVDIFENEAEDGPIPFVVDSRAPKLTITAPFHGALLNTGSVTVRGEAEKNRPVRLTLDGVMVGDATADGNGAFAFPLPGVLAEGPHEVVAEMTDLAGNAATARTMFDIDTEAPWLRLERPGEERIFTEREVEFGGFGEPKAKLVVVVIQTDLDPEEEFGRFGVVVGENGQWSVTSDALPDGTFRAEATASDDAGNTSAAETVDFEVDSRSPMLVIDRPLKGTLTNNRTPTVEGSTDARATIRIAVLDAQGTEVTTSQPDVDGEGAFVWTIDPPLDDGVYRIRVTATGPNGFQTSGEVDLTVDATAPALAITSPTDGETVKGVWLTVSGTAESDTVVDLYLDGDAIANLNIYENTDWRVALERPVSPGPHNLSAIGRDAAGNSTTVTAAFTIESDGITGPGDLPPDPGDGTGSGSEKDGCGGGGAGGVGLGLLLVGLLARRRR